MTLPRPLVMIGLLLLIVALSVASMSAGRVWIPWSDWASQRGDPAWAILFELRLPRSVLALIVGAVLGLIHVMENLADPSKLGAGIAVAFVATIYGVGFANLVFLPVAKKLLGVIGTLVSMREMLVDGLVGIANGDNPRIIESRLKGYAG